MNRKGLLTGARERRDSVGDQLELCSSHGLMRTIERADSKVSRMPVCHPASIEHLFASCKRLLGTISVIGNAAPCRRVLTDMRVDVSTAAAAAIARKGGTAVVDLLEPYG